MDVRRHYHTAGWPQVSAVWAVCKWLKVGGKKPRMWKLLPPVATLLAETGLSSFTRLTTGLALLCCCGQLIVRCCLAKQDNSDSNTISTLWLPGISHQRPHTHPPHSANTSIQSAHTLSHSARFSRATRINVHDYRR